MRAMFENAVRGASAAAPNRRIVGAIRPRAVPGMRSVRGVVSVLIVHWRERSGSSGGQFCCMFSGGYKQQLVGRTLHDQVSNSPVVTGAT